MKEGQTSMKETNERSAQNAKTEGRSTLKRVIKRQTS